MVITRKFTNHRIVDPIRINDELIHPKNAVKYLGITLDARLRFHLHTNNVRNKTFIALQKTYTLLSRNSVLSPQNKLTIYKQFIRPVITYGAPIWCSMSDSQFARLQRLQNMFLRYITASRRFERVHALQDMINTPYIKE